MFFSFTVAVDCQSSQMSVKIAPFGQFTGKIFVKDFEDNPNCSFNNMGDVWELNLDYFSGCGAGIDGQTVFNDIPKVRGKKLIHFCLKMTDSCYS